MAFANVQKAVQDPIQELTKITRADKTADKIDVGAGVYRNEEGQYVEFQTLRKESGRRDAAKERLNQEKANHDYNPTTGIASFRRAAAELLFGSESPLLAEGRIASVQTVAGTGANRTGAAFLYRHLRLQNGRIPKVYFGEPAWANYKPLLLNAGFEVETFHHSSRTDVVPDLESIIQTARQAPEGSIFVLQACCHNPTGLDYTSAQWKEIADVFLGRNHFAFFDAAYQGFGSAEADGLDQDAFAVRHFASKGINMLACQSFSKNFGLYSERVGALHVVCKSAAIAENVFDQLRVQIRWEFSSAPAYGASLVDIILRDEVLRKEWQEELRQATSRIEKLRGGLHALLTEKHKTPGSWDHIVKEKGLFSYPDLDKAQVDLLVYNHRVYLPPSGRVNIAGLSQSNIERAAGAINHVVTRQHPKLSNGTS